MFHRWISSDETAQCLRCGTTRDAGAEEIDTLPIVCVGPENGAPHHFVASSAAVAGEWKPAEECAWCGLAVTEDTSSIVWTCPA